MGVLPGLEASDLFSSLHILCAPCAPPRTPGLQDAAGRMEGTKPALRGPAAGQPACKSLHCPTFLADMLSPVRPSSEPKLPESQGSREPLHAETNDGLDAGLQEDSFCPVSSLRSSEKWWPPVLHAINSLNKCTTGLGFAFLCLWS